MALQAYKRFRFTDKSLDLIDTMSGIIIRSRLAKVTEEFDA